MSDLRDLAHQVNVRLLDKVRLASAEDLIAAGRRRNRRRRTAAAIGIVVLCAIVAVAATPIWRHEPAPTTAASPAQLRHRVVLDGGALILDQPDAGAPRPHVTQAQALAVGPQVQYPLLGDPLNLVLARVSAHVASRSPGLPTTWRLAWVQFYRQNGPMAACPGSYGNTPTPSPGARPTKEDALIIDASTGAASIYFGYGIHLCPPPSSPSLQPARAEYSVAFDVQPNGSLLVHMPPCADASGAPDRGPSSGIGGTLAAGEFQVLVTAPIGPCGRPGSVESMANPYQERPTTHAPVGQILRLGGHSVIQPSPMR
jgi:hypothetical protein